MNEKRLLIVLGSMGRGGAERVISLISDDFCKRGWKVYIVLLLFNKVEYVLNENVTVINLSGEGQSRTKRLPGWIFGIRKLVKEVKPDSILSFAARINIITQIACLGLGQRIVVSERNDPYMDGRSKIIDFLTYLLYPRAKAVVFQTRRAAGYFKRRKLKNDCIIVNPIEVATFKSCMQEGKIVSAGRLEPQKNQKMLIRAFARVVEEFPKASLTIFGSGSLEDELKELTRLYNIENKVQFPGNVIDIHNRICDANVFVLSSDYEGLSNALLEAMMIGLPCISTDCAGADEYIENGKNGILINVGDEDGLVYALRKMLSNKEEATYMGEEAHIKSKLFEKESVLEKWYQVISK